MEELIVRWELVRAMWQVEFSPGPLLIWSWTSIMRQRSLDLVHQARVGVGSWIAIYTWVALLRKTMCGSKGWQHGERITRQFFTSPVKEVKTFKLNKNQVKKLQYCILKLGRSNIRGSCGGLANWPCSLSPPYWVHHELVPLVRKRCNVQLMSLALTPW